MVIASCGVVGCVCLTAISFYEPGPFGGLVLSRSFLILCGQVFKGTRWMPWH
jgi:hypothetical protein